MNGRQRTVQIKFRVTEEERALIEQKMKLIPTDNMAAYLRKIAIDGYIIKVDHTDMPDRVPYDKIPQFIEENLEELSADISPKTPRNLACAAFNFWEGLLNPRHKLKPKAYKLFTLFEDYGVRQLSYGNAGGGVFYGLYRSFIIDYKGSTEIVSIGFTPYGSFANADTEKTAMVVAIDNEDDSHHALQYSIDDNLRQVGNTYTFYHHGKIAIGNKGSGKVSELMQFVAPEYAEIIEGKKFNLGHLTFDKDWDLNNPEVEKLIENIISYALLRDEYREQIKKAKTNS